MAEWVCKFSQSLRKFLSIPVSVGIELVFMLLELYVGIHDFQFWKRYNYMVLIFPTLLFSFILIIIIYKFSNFVFEKKLNFGNKVSLVLSRTGTM